MFGYFPGDIIGRPVDEFLDETNQNILKVQTERRRKRSAEPYEIEWTRKDGSKIPTITSPKPVFDVNSQFKGSFAVITDITERKRAEEALRHLSSQLLTIQEQERKRISKELHDELGQALAVLKIQQTHIEKSLHDDQEAIREECKESVQHIDQIIEDVRRLSRDLSPYTLEYFGLTAALKRLINDFTKNHKIEVTADITRVDPLFSKEKQIIIYRIFQETFNNIRKHAQAKHVTAVIRKDESGVFISVEDDGKGFNMAEMDLKDPAQKGLGFAILDERVRMLGGTLDLWSEGGKGTRISFTAPIQEIEKKVE
jgi:PAS domain S-box-containing protein